MSQIIQQQILDLLDVQPLKAAEIRSKLNLNKSNTFNALLALKETGKIQHTSIYWHTGTFNIKPLDQQIIDFLQAGPRTAQQIITALNIPKYQIFDALGVMRRKAQIQHQSPWWGIEEFDKPRLKLNRVENQILEILSSGPKTITQLYAQLDVTRQYITQMLGKLEIADLAHYGNGHWATKQTAHQLPNSHGALMNFQNELISSMIPTALYVRSEIAEYFGISTGNMSNRLKSSQDQKLIELTYTESVSLIGLTSAGVEYLNQLKPSEKIPPCDPRKYMSKVCEILHLFKTHYSIIIHDVKPLVLNWPVQNENIASQYLIRMNHWKFIQCVEVGHSNRYAIADRGRAIMKAINLYQQHNTAG